MKPVSFVVLAFLLFAPSVSADYGQELRDQIAELKKDYPQPRPEYFRDAGILAHKADDAGLYDIAIEIVRNLLLDKMAQYVKSEIDEINRLYPADAFQAGRRFQDLVRFERVYEPSGEFLRTAAAQGVMTELVRKRTRALETFKRGCLDFSILDGITAVRQTGLFATGAPAEIESLRHLDQEVGCCLGWKPEIHLSRKEIFETDYEQGTIREEARLRLESSRTDLSQARWGGEYIYRFKGREGEAQGVSQAVLTFRKGQDQAVLAITTSRVTSTGRMNLPHALSGERRTLEVEGNPVNPSFGFFEFLIPMTGCRETTVQNEN